MNGTDLATERAALLKADNDWAAAAAAGDIKTVLGYWTEDAIDYFPNGPAAEGIAQIQEMIGSFRSIPGYSLSWEATNAIVSCSSDLGYTSGPFRVTLNGEDGTPITREGHHIVIWHKQADGEWKAVAMANFRRWSKTTARMGSAGGIATASCYPSCNERA